MGMNELVPEVCSTCAGRWTVARYWGMLNPMAQQTQPDLAVDVLIAGGGIAGMTMGLALAGAGGPAGLQGECKTRWERGCPSGLPLLVPPAVSAPSGHRK